MSETQLLPCPSCGYKARFEISREGVFVYCARNGCRLCTRVYPTRIRAIAAWNTRAPDPRIAAAQSLADALMFVQRWFQTLEEGTEDGDPLKDMRRKFHAPIHATIGPALAAWEKLK